MIDYVLGFFFSPDLSQVVLIQKNRPAEQLGKLNGVGGRVEENELPHSAMAREFKEEAGLEVPIWVHVETIQGWNSEYRIHSYVATGNPYACKAMTDETLILVNTLDLKKASPVALANDLLERVGNAQLKMFNLYKRDYNLNLLLKPIIQDPENTCN